MQQVKMNYADTLLNKIKTLTRSSRELAKINDLLRLEIAERQMAVKALSENESQLRNLIHNISGYVYAVDFYGGKAVSTFHSPQCFNITGYTPEQYHQNPYLWMQMIHEKDRNHVVQYIEKSYKQPGSYEIEHRIIKNDSSIIWVNNHYTVSFNKNSEVARIDGLITDITRHKKDKLELKQAKEQAENANRFKSEFLAMMSHDIRTPMNGILGLTDLLLNEKNNERQERYLKMIQHSGQELIHLINDILDVSKIEAGQLTIESIAFNLVENIESVIKPLETAAHRKGIQLITDIEKELPSLIVSDPFRLQQIIVNLVGNAVKFTHQGGVLLKISGHELGDNEILLKVDVLDSGIGIPADKLPSIFKRFEQANSSRDFGGTGLGTAIARNLSELMNGSIGVDSPVREKLPFDKGGPGSRFFVELPVETVSEYVENNVDDKGNSVTDNDTANIFKDIRILVAEDNQINQVLIMNMLNTCCGEIDLAVNGLEALEKAVTADYDIILMDVQMPEKNGIEVTKELRSTGIDIPIIACTANAFADDRRQCFNAGMNDILIKPYNKKSLFDVLKRHLF